MSEPQHSQEWYDCQEQALAWGEHWDDDSRPPSTSMDD